MATLMNVSVTRRHLVLAAFLAAATLAVYTPVLENGFVDLDDHAYLDGNPHVRVGFTRHSVAWAFTTLHMGSWHPLTWLSHLADIELFGLDPLGHHVVGAAIHAASTALLFLLVRGLSGSLWPSALVAALFGLHPLRVESVAWAAERKDVLSTCLWLCTTHAYLRYVRRPQAAAYAAVCVLLLLGLMAKPMLVTLPFTLLLLDGWPLGRFRTDFGAGRPAVHPRSRAARLLLEKVPLLALAALFSAAALVSQRLAGAVRPAEVYPFSIRVANAFVSYLRYLGKTLYPQGLAVVYPHPRADLSAAQALVAAAVLLGASSVAVLLWRRRPYLAVGWFWYLGTLVPVIGLVQIGAAASADRYTYVPHVGLFVLIVWALRDLWRRWRLARRALVGLAVAALAACSALTWAQIGVWRNSVTLFRHAVAVTQGNWQGHLDLALSLSALGRAEEARAEFREVLRLRPGYIASHQEFGIDESVGGTLDKALAAAGAIAGAEAEAAYRRGEALVAAGRLAEAIPAYETALALEPGFVEARYALANAIAETGGIDEAIASYQRLLVVSPGHWEGRNNLGVALIKTNRPAEAEEQFRESLRLFSRNAAAHGNLGFILSGQGRYTEAAGHLEEALRIKPDDTRAMASYAEVLLRMGRTAEAERWSRETARLAPGNQRAQDLLREIRSRR